MAKVKLFAPEGTTGCSFDGETFEVVNGTVEVPDKAIEALSSHGFATSREAVSKPAATPEALALDAMKAERDAAQARVAELEAELSKKRK